MTNGEKIKAMFPSMEVGFITDLQVGIYFVKNQHSATVFSLDWWNAEYKEPTTKNDLGVDCISREQALVAIRNLYPGMPRVDFNGSLRKWVDKYKPYIECEDAIKQLPSVTPIRPKGHWIEEFNDTEGEVRFTCSSCGKYQLFETDYCYNCGSYNGGASNGNE